MFTISNKKGQCLTRATAQEALNDFKQVYKPTAAQVLDIREVVEDPKIPGSVLYVWGAKAAKGRAAFIQQLIDQGKL